MNLILCDKNCAYQKDGYCSLDTVTSLNASKEDGCFYFLERSSICKNSHKENGHPLEENPV